MKKKDIYAEAIKKWSIKIQLEMLAEESLELALAVRHFQRGRINSLDCLVEEMVDVEIMLEQIKSQTCGNLSGNSFYAIKRKKLKRLRERIDNVQK